VGRRRCPTGAARAAWPGSTGGAGVTDASAAGALALSQIRDGRLNGLSIGFIARDWTPRVAQGRELREIDLREISLVASPMLQTARFAAVGGARALDRRIAA